MLEAIFRLIISLGILVFVHEFGHFILAKFVGIRVERFSLGFPPRMIGKKIGDTDYCISWIPLGGYVKMSGMIDESLDSSSIKGEPWEFMSKPIYQRFLVIFAGPAMNLLLAVLLFSGIAYIMGLNEPVGTVVGKPSSQRIVEQTGLQTGDMILTVNNQPVKTWSDFEDVASQAKQLDIQFERGNERLSTTFSSSLVDSFQRTLPPVVGDLNDGFPAEEAGMQVGDRIVSIDGKEVKTWNGLTEIIHAQPEKPLQIKWERNGEYFTAEITPKLQKQQGQEIGLIGISYPMQEFRLNPFQSLVHGAEYSWMITRLTYQYVKLVIQGEHSFKDAFGGPIMIAKLAKDSAQQGESNFIAFIAFLSLNLGILNLLPIPVLDGGHLIFLAIEGIIRKPIPNKTKLIIQQVGMVLLIALMVFVIINDIGRLIN